MADEVPWLGVCGYPVGRGMLCGVKVRRGARYCAVHGGFEPDEVASARRAYEHHRRAAQAEKINRALNRRASRIDTDRSEEAQNLFLRVFRGQVGGYTDDEK